MARDAQVAVAGGGVVGCAVAAALASRGIATVLLEAREALATEASGTNSGILHTGFDSHPGELETELILEAAQGRGRLVAALGVPVLRCGARLRAGGEEQERAVRALAANASRNGVRAELREGGRELLVPGEAITDPVAFTEALAGRAAAGGAEIRLGSPVAALGRVAAGIRVELAGGGALEVGGVANCAGLHADEVAASAGDRTFEVYPRKGEFLVFEQPAEPLREILLPVPSAAGKGVLVFPTVDGHVIAGPTARDRTDKADWSVEGDAAELILARARSAHPPLEGADPLASYAGLRPAGRGANYVIAPSAALPGLVNAAAIRSTGLTASPAIGARVASLLIAAAGLQAREPRELPVLAPRAPESPWWRLAAARSAGAPQP